MVHNILGSAGLVIPIALQMQTRDVIQERFPNIKGEIRICDVGTIIASHCGPGTVAVYFFGDDRASPCCRT